MWRCVSILSALVLTLLASGPARAGEATAAVAANFLSTAQELVTAYGDESGHNITLAHGSTGRLYAQIVNGAPFDLFLAADAQRPRRLEEAGLAVTRVPYALGRLVLVSRAHAPLPDALRGARIAMADPAVAPYGQAALSALADMELGLTDIRPLLGDSVGQAASIFVTGNADYAFLARAQLEGLGQGLIATTMDGRHPPIRQDAVLLSRGADNSAARGFIDFLRSDRGRALIGAAGYEVPE